MDGEVFRVQKHENVKFVAGRKKRVIRLKIFLRINKCILL